MAIFYQSPPAATVVTHTATILATTLKVDTANAADGGDGVGLSVIVSIPELEIVEEVVVTISGLEVVGGVSATPSELELVEEVVVTISELAVVDGVSATPSELNVVEEVVVASLLQIPPRSSMGKILRTFDVSGGDANAKRNPNRHCAPD